MNLKEYRAELLKLRPTDMDCKEEGDHAIGGQYYIDEALSLLDQVEGDPQ